MDEQATTAEAKRAGKNGGSSVDGLSAGARRTLSGSTLFSGMDPAAREGLFDLGRVVALAPGEHLFRVGDKAPSLYVVLSGQVQMFRGDGETKLVMLRFAGKGESFGLTGALAFGRRYYAAAAIDRADVAAIPAKPFRDRLAQDPQLGIRVIAEISRHLHETDNLIERLESMPTPVRLASYLLDLADSEDLPSGERPTLRLPTEKSLIAARLGMQPESLSRAFLKLRDIGVRSEGRRVTIGDLDRLRAYVRP